MAKKNIHLFQPQFAVEIYKKKNYWLPYSVGCLWAYASQHEHITDNFNLVELHFRREDPLTVLERLHDPVLCGFSCYVWNEQYCLDLARMIKERFPRCIIEFGGPQTSGKMLEHDFIDVIMMGEGEQGFVDLLENILHDRTIPQLYPKTRLEKLDIPSPYVTGVFDSLIQQNPGVIWAMVLETNRGCPFQCTFCDWGSATYSKVKKFNLEKVQEEIEWCAANPVAFIFCADANFGVFKERDIEIARMLRLAGDVGMLESVNVQYAKNSTEVVFEIGRILGDLSRGITMSMQSMNHGTLEAIKRANLDINNLKKLLDLSEKYQVGTYTEMILGLPLETAESWKSGMCEVLECGQHSSIDIWFCQLLENSELNSPESRNRYGINTVTALDYMSFVDPDDYSGSLEKIEIVNSTNTMTTPELIESYMYAWMIVQFHIAGYTQWYARYARNVLNVPYREFYDVMFREIQKDPTFGAHFKELLGVVTHYLTTGKIDDSVPSRHKGHGLGSESFAYIYDHRQAAFDLGMRCFEDFGSEVPALAEFQKHFIFDKQSVYPVTVTMPCDVSNWAHGKFTYQLHSRNVMAAEDFNFYVSRRKGLLKNRIEVQG